MTVRICGGCGEPAGDEHWRTYCRHCGAELPDGFLVRHRRLRRVAGPPGPAPPWFGGPARRDDPVPRRDPFPGRVDGGHAPDREEQVAPGPASGPGTGQDLEDTARAPDGGRPPAPVGAAVLAASVLVVAALVSLVAAAAALVSAGYLGELMGAIAGRLPDDLDDADAGRSVDALDRFVAANPHTTARALVIVTVVLVVVVFAQALFVWWLARAYRARLGASGRFSPRSALLSLTTAGPSGASSDAPTPSAPAGSAAVFSLWWWGSVVVAVVIPLVAVVAAFLGVDGGGIAAAVLALAATWVAVALGAQAVLVADVTRGAARRAAS